MPATKNLHTEIISQKRLDTTTHLGQIRIFDQFWGTLEVKKDQKMAISLKVPPPEAENVHREIISLQIFHSVTHLGQIRNFDTFCGSLGVQMGVKKGQKLPIPLIISHKSSTFARGDNFS